MQTKSSVFGKDSVIQQYQSKNHTHSQALKSSAVCFPVNSCDSQVDVIRSPHPEATVTHTSAHSNIALLFSHAHFYFNPMAESCHLRKLASLSLPCTPSHQMTHLSTMGASGLKTKESDDAEVSKICATRSQNAMSNHIRHFHFNVFTTAYFCPNTNGYSLVN